ncbi:MAG: hypothetical protein JSW30_04505 [Dehalococcoidia bacterium]|nr:MAG: hypothetical protein JSW30_04505 [Dehalococcoidia bacterium]
MTNRNTPELPWNYQALLTEYQVCQQHNNSRGSQYWITVGIFLGINTAFLVAVANVMSKAPVPEYSKWFVFGIGVAIVLIIICLFRWLNRVNWYIRIDHARMREIEETLGMLKNRTIHWVDHPNQAPNEQRQRIENLRQQYPPPLRGSTVVPPIFGILGFLWLFFIILAFIN